MTRRRFQPPGERQPTNPYDVAAAVIATLLIAWMVVVVAFLPRTARADHDGEDQPWRKPMLLACLPNWDYGSTRVVVDRPGYPQHNKSLHDQPYEVRHIFYSHWVVWADNHLSDAHLIQWRREYECTHPPGKEVEVLVTAAGQPGPDADGERLPRGGGGPADGSPTPPPGYPLPTVAPIPLPTVTPAPTVTRMPDPYPAVTCPLHAGETWPNADLDNDMYRNGEHRHHGSGVVHAHHCDVVRRVSDPATLTTN